MLVNFKVSDSGIAQNLLKGVQVKKTQRIEVDFSELQQADREILLRHARLIDEQLYVGKFQEYYTTRFTEKHFEMKDESASVSGPALADVLATLRAWEAEVVAKQKAEMEERLESVGLYLQGKGAILAFNYTVYSDFSEVRNGNFPIQIVLDWANKYCPEKTALIEAEYQRRVDFWAQKRAEEAAKKAKEAAKKAEAEAEAEAAKQRLQNWAEQNGSELLRLRIEAQMNWIELALAEFSDGCLADSEPWEAVWENVDEAKDSWSIKNATLVQLKTLKEYQAKFPEQSVKLTRIKYLREDEYEDDTTYHKDFLVLSFEAPNGATVKRAIFLNDYPGQD